MNNREFVFRWFKGNFNKGSYGNLRMDRDAVYSYGTHFPLVYRCANGFVLNGDRYSISTSGHQRDVQDWFNQGKSVGIGDTWKWVPKTGLEKHVVVPFEVLRNVISCFDANDCKKIRIVHNLKDRYRTIKYRDPQTGEEKERQEHLLGGSVFEYKGRYFLSSTDPSARWGHGYFLTELVKPVKTVTQALESLRPPSVPKTAKRQGEWFFRPIKDIRSYKRAKSPRGLEDPFVVEKGKFLPVMEGQTGHHKVRDFVQVGGILLVRGSVRHTERDHKMLSLGETWHEAVHNVQVRSWSVSGRVD